MRISDWSSDVCSSDLIAVLEHHRLHVQAVGPAVVGEVQLGRGAGKHADGGTLELQRAFDAEGLGNHETLTVVEGDGREIQTELGVTEQRPRRGTRPHVGLAVRSEEHTSALKSLMRISYAFF